MENELPKIAVNEVEIPQQLIFAEMQYHPAQNRRGALVEAARTAVISELLRQRAVALDLLETNLDVGTMLDKPGDSEGIIDQLLEQEVAAPEASEENCRRFYEQNRDSFVSSPQASVWHILLAAAPDDQEARTQAVIKARDMIEKLRREPGHMQVLANQYSRCPSAEQGGYLGVIGRGDTVPEFEKAVFRQAPGLMEQPLETRYGVHVISVDEVIPGQQLDYEQVAERIRQYLDEKVRRKAIAQYVEHLAGEARITGISLASSDSPLMQ